MGPAAIAARSLSKSVADTAASYMKNKKEGEKKAEQLVDSLIISNVPVVGTVTAVREGAKEVREAVDKAKAEKDDLVAAGHYADAALAATETAAVIVGDVVAHAHAPGKIYAKVAEPHSPKFVPAEPATIASKPPMAPSNDWMSERNVETKKQQNDRVATAEKDYIGAGGEPRVIKDPIQDHHVASDKSSAYAERFEKIFEDGDLTLQSKNNRISIEGHKGAHGPDYHEAVLKRLTTAIDNKAPHSPEYRQALRDALVAIKRDLDRPGSQLNNLVTGKKQ